VNYRHPTSRVRTTGLLLGIIAGLASIGAPAEESSVNGKIAQIEGPHRANPPAQLTNPENPTSESGTAGLSELTLQQIMDKLHVPGASIAVIKDFKIHWAKAYGVADAESARPVQLDTRFQAASISKPLTAMAALRLVQEGRFSLDDDVNKLLKSWKVPSSAYTAVQPVTPRSLFSHTSGADDGFGFLGYEPGSQLPSIMQILDGQPPSNGGPVLFARPPYEKSKYSGGGILIMQLALTDMLHEPFERIMQKYVLQPLRMSHSSYEQPPPSNPTSISQYAFAHDKDGRRFTVPWHVFPEQAAAGLWTTPTDLAHFIIEIQRAVRGPSGAVLRQAAAREMISPIGEGPFAVGIRLSNKGDGWYVFHGGQNFGFEALIIGHIRKGYGAVIMTNSEDGSTPFIEELEARIMDAYEWDRPGR
jgi:CubicO group peptidase (beta-lactamase class C family)